MIQGNENNKEITLNEVLNDQQNGDDTTRVGVYNIPSTSANDKTKPDGDVIVANSQAGTGPVIITPEQIRQSILATGGTLHEGEKRYDDIVDHMCKTFGVEARNELRARAIKVVQQQLQDGKYDEHFGFKDTELLDDAELNNNNNDQRSDHNHNEHSDSENVITPNKEPLKEKVNIHNPSDEYVESGSIEDEEYDEKEYDPEKELEIVKAKIKEKISPITQPIDLASFTVSNKPIGLLKAITQSKTETVKTADWVMCNSGFGLSMKELDGSAIEKLDTPSSNRSVKNATLEAYNVLYDHLVTENLPPLEVLFRTLKFRDLDHLYFLAYRSSFDKDNLLTFKCPNTKCNEIFVEDVNMDDMVKYKDDKTEKEIKAMLEATNNIYTDKEIEKERIQISDSYVVDLAEPSIYGMTIDLLSLPEGFKNKYSEILGMILYIDGLYFIDREVGQLAPINYKVDETNLEKTLKNKFYAYKEVIDSLNSDQFSLLSGLIGKLSDMYEEDPVTYIIPSKKCPKCGALTHERPEPPFKLLFTRHRLAVLASM